MLVALRNCLNGGGRKQTDPGRPDPPALPQQSDQPLPLHDHQQRRQEGPEEFLLLQPSGRSSCCGIQFKFIFFERDKKSFHSRTELISHQVFTKKEYQTKECWWCRIIFMYLLLG